MTLDREIVLREITPAFQPNLAFKLMTTPRMRRSYARYRAHRNYMARRGKPMRSFFDPVADLEIMTLRKELNMAVSIVAGELKDWNIRLDKAWRLELQSVSDSNAPRRDYQVFEGRVRLETNETNSEFGQRRKVT